MKNYEKIMKFSESFINSTGQRSDRLLHYDKNFTHLWDSRIVGFRGLFVTSMKGA